MLGQTPYVTPPPQDYDNFWDGVVDLAKWSLSTGGGSSITDANGGLQVISNAGGTASIRTLVDLRSFFRWNVGVALESHADANLSGFPATGHTNSGVSYVSLWDGGANEIILVKSGSFATNGGYNNRDGHPAIGGGGGAIISLQPEGSKIRVFITGVVKSNGSTMVSGASVTDQSSIIANNTLVDTSAWTAVYLRCYASGSNDVLTGTGTLILTLLQTVGRWVGSKGTL